MAFKTHQCNKHNLHEQVIQRAVYIAKYRLVMINWVEFKGSTEALIEARSHSFSVQLKTYAPAGLEAGTFCNATATSEHVASAARTCRQTET
jgi:hypothetical protein